MRSFRIAAIVGIVAVYCAGQPALTPPQSSVQSTNLPPQPASDVPSAVAGTWRFGEKTILLELSRAGRWRWWSEQSGLPSESPLFEGSWFVRKGILFLLIEKTREPTIGLGCAGWAMTFDVKSVASDALVLHQVTRNDDYGFRRVPELPGAADRSQPSNTQTNRASGAADSGRRPR